MTTFDTQITEYKSVIMEKGQYTYLDKHVQSPVIEEEKLFLLICNYHQTNLSQPRKDNAIVTTMLVQNALDIHDTVVMVTEPNEKEEKKRNKQLSVLAGDYYSGLYYSLLAGKSDFGLIRVLASAIKEINEGKMDLYYNSHDSLETYIQIVRKVESLLYTQTAVYTENNAMEQLMADWLLVNRLVKERRQLLKNCRSTLFSSWAKQDTNLPDRLESTINEYKKRIINRLNKLPNGYDGIRDQMIKRLYYNFVTTPITQREEG